MCAAQVLSRQAGLLWASLSGRLMINKWKSDMTVSFQIFLGRPWGFLPLIWPNNMILNNLLSCILQTWPYQLSLLLLNWDSMEHSWHVDKMSAFKMWSLSDMQHMYLKKLIKKTDFVELALFKCNFTSLSWGACVAVHFALGQKSNISHVLKVLGPQPQVHLLGVRQSSLIALQHVLIQVWALGTHGCCLPNLCCRLFNSETCHT